MTRTRIAFVLATALLGLPACTGSAYADRIGPGGGAPAPLEEQPVAPRTAPFDVALIDEEGRPLDTFQHKGRYYVAGAVGKRYSVRVTNPTSERIEAVISVDGLDAIDGRTADFLTKRGYIVPPYGELKVDGFRVSLQDVATFRFSAVKDSYAGRKGQPRHVGVVGVAIFTERLQDPVYVPEPYYPDYDRRNDDRWDGAERERPARGGDAPAGGGHATGAQARPNTKTGEANAPANEPTAPSPAPPADARAARPPRHDPDCCQERPKDRPGLGTEFGERRVSQVSYTRFERESPTHPSAVAELRYNDRDGLAALGIPLRNPVTAAELELRESASPFPDSPYAPPPPNWK